MKPIVIISLGYSNASSPQHQRIKSIAIDLIRELGLDVIILTFGFSQLNDIAGMKVNYLPLIQDKFGSRHKAKISTEPNVHQDKSTSVNNSDGFNFSNKERMLISKVLGTINQLLFFFWAINYLIRNAAKTEAVITTSPSGISHISALVPSKLFSTIWIADFRDPWYLNPVKQENSISRRVKKILEPIIISRADHCSFTTSATLNKYSDRYPQQRNKFVLLMNGYDQDEILMVKRGHQQKRDSLVLCYTGFLGSTRPIKPLLDAIEFVIHNFPEYNEQISLEIAGQADSKSLEHIVFAQRRGLNVSYYYRITREQALQLALTADWFIVLSYSHEQIPSKIFDSIGLGIPIFLISVGGETASFVENNEFGIFVKPETHLIAEKILAILRSNVDHCMPNETYKWTRSRQNQELIRILRTSLKDSPKSK